MREAVLSNHPKNVLDSFASRLIDFQKVQWPRSAPTDKGVGFSTAVRARENCADAPDGIEVWRYTFPLAENQPVDDVHVRFTMGGGQSGTWTGIFACARGRHVEVLPWSTANAVVVAAANALYIVDPSRPEQFSGVAAPVEIDDVIFDESARHLYVADSRRIYAFSADRRFQWISEPLDGYGARFRGCGGRMLAVELKESEPTPEGEEAAPSVIYLRTEDGTILRSRFSRLHRNRGRSWAA